MNRVIHFNRPGIAPVSAQRRKFRMPVFKTCNMRSKSSRASAFLQIRVTLRATLVPRRNDIHSSAMLRVARRATKCFGLRGVMHRPIVARQTSRIAGLRGKRALPLQVARRALSLQHRVRRAHPPARVHPRIARETVPPDPHQSNRRHANAQPKPRALQRRRPLEVIQVDPLRQLLGCSCSRHSFTSSEAEGPLIYPGLFLRRATSSIPQSHHRMHRTEQDQRQRKRYVHQQPAVQ